MPRKPNLDPSTRLELAIPETLRARLDLILFSELEGRVRLGKYSEFFIARLQEYLDSRRLDLAPYGFAPGYGVTGPKPVIDALEQRLREAYKET